MEAAATRYRVMAYVVGIFLLVLCVGMYLEYGPPKDKTMVQIVGPIHGVLYMVYLAVAYDLYRRVEWPVSRMVAMVCAGLIPFLAFYVERRVLRDLPATEPARP